MDFNYELTLNVPIDYAFERFSNIKEISETLPANIVLRPEGSSHDLSEGSKWVVKAQRSGRNFVIRNKVIKNDRPNNITFESDSNRIESVVSIDFEETGPESCLVKTNFDLQPKGLLGRILLQSIKASKSRITSAMDSGTVRLQENLEEDYQASK